MNGKSLRQTKLAPASEFPFEVEINLYGGGETLALCSLESKSDLLLRARRFTIPSRVFLK